MQEKTKYKNNKRLRRKVDNKNISIEKFMVLLYLW